MIINSLKNIRGSLYTISLNALSDKISLRLENKDSLEDWHCSYTKHEIEEITKKTGCFKRYSSFVAMLEASLKKTKDSVHLDILTSCDLERLKEERFGHKSYDIGSKDKAKMYLVLTHCDDFGSQVHYPLSLSASTSDGGKISSSLEKDVDSIKYQTNQNLLKQEVKFLRKEVLRLKKEKFDLGAAFMAYKEEVEGQSGGEGRQVGRLQSQIEKLKKELSLKCKKSADERRVAAMECKALKQETERLRRCERELKMKVQKLSTELMHFRRSRSEQRASRDSSLDSKGRLPITSRPLRNSHFPYKSLRTSSSSPPRHRKSFSQPPLTRYPPPPRPLAHRPSRLRSATPTSSLLSRLTRPTSSSSLKRLPPLHSTHLLHSSATNTVVSSSSSHRSRMESSRMYVPNGNKGSIDKRSEHIKRSNNLSPSSSLSSFTSSYSSAPLLKRKIKNKQRIYEKNNINEFNAIEIDEIDARLQKLKMFMNEHL